MSELAFTQNGDPFEVPAGVTGWRVRRMKPRGAPELVYGKDGRPLVLPIEADMEDLREAVGQLGRYRLDPVNEDNKVNESIPAAYIQVVRAERNAAPVEVVAPRDESDGAVREAMRLNTELAKSVIDQFPAMMTAAAELLRAADGAGIPARAPRLVETEDDDGDEDDATPSPAPGFDLAALLPQLAPILMALFSGKGGKGIDIGAMLDWRKAAPQANESAAPAAERSERPKKVPRETTAKPTAPTATTAPAASESATSASDALPPIDPQTMAHFIAIQSALSPEEAALARDVAGELAPAELRAWFDELSKLSVPQAVQKIRVLIAGNTEAVS